MKTGLRDKMDRNSSSRLNAAALGVALILAALSLLACLKWAPSASAAGNASKLETSKSAEPGEYIVVFRKSVALGTRLDAEEDRGVEVNETYRNVFKGFAGELDPTDVERLERDDRVLIIEPDRKVMIQSNRPQDRSTPSWGLDRIDQRTLPLNSRLVTGNNGFGVESYVIDTGVRLDHTQFSGRMNTEGFSAFPGGWNDCEGHGTHVAGTVAGSTYGVAPASRVTAVRVLDCDGSGTNSSVIAGIDWMIADHRAGEPAVGNMSLGGGRSETVNAAVERAVADGITMAVAAGNESSDACGTSPASAPSAVTVGSTSRTDAMSDFSNTGQCVDIFAPGSNIVSASAASPSAVETLSGTSMASPHVAGAAALLLSAQPSMTPAAVASRLVASSTPGAITSLRGCSMNRLLHVGSGPDLPGPDAPPRPALDDYSNAQTLSSLTGVNATSICASKETGEPSHGSGSAASIWYRWTAPSSGTLTLDTTGSSFDTLLAVYTGSSVGSLTQRAQNDDSGSGLTSRVSLPVAAGTTYSIAIDGYGGDNGATRISGTFSGGGGDPGNPGDPNRPANDTFANGSSFALSSQASGSNSGATAETGEPGHAQPQASASIWYRWTAPSSGNLTLDTSGSSFDTTLAVYTGSSVGSLTRRAEDDDSGSGATSRVSLPVAAGTTYSIAIDGFLGDSGSTRLSGSLSTGDGNPGDPTDPSRPANDDFGAASRIGSWVSPIDTSNEGATAEVGEPSHEAFTPGDSAIGSIWYRWTAPSNGLLEIDTESRWGKHIAVYTGSSLDSLNKIDAGWRDVAVPVRSGTEYRIAVDSFSVTSREDITIDGSFTAAPDNDDFADARRVDSWSSTIAGTNVAATTEIGEPSHSPDSDERPEASVWYRWTAPTNGLLTLDARETSFRHPRVAVYTGTSVASLESVGRDRNDLTITVRSGVEYRIAVDTWWPDEVGQVRLAGSFAGAPGNDDFADATTIDLRTQTVVGRNHASTSEPGEPRKAEAGSATDSSGSIWYRWTAPSDMRAVFSSTGVQDVSVYTGPSVQSLTEVSSSSIGQVGFRARAGTTYSIAVYDSALEEQSSEFRLRRPMSMPRLVAKPKAYSRSATARFVFRGEPGATFECQRKGQSSWKRCGKKTTLRNLKSGEHWLKVRQRDGVSVSMAREWFWSVGRG